jgi:hypothetical protein
VRSLNHLGGRPVSLPLSADDIVEFHAARLLLLLDLCGTAGRIDGLTKLAKLDFFVRYPDFFAFARAAGDADAGPAAQPHAGRDDTVESAMVRHHYGPWDKRYYHVLANLEAKRLIDVSKHGNAYRIALSDLGRERARALAARSSFRPLAERMREVKKVFGSRSGSSLKGLVYRLFEEEVGRRPLGEVIQR